MAAIQMPISTDRYWKGVIYLFKNHSKLKRYFTTQYFDMEKGVIEVTKLKRLSAGTRTSPSWSTSETFMLNLALHLYNDSHKVNLSDMDYLDDHNKKLAMEAITLRFF